MPRSSAPSWGGGQGPIREDFANVLELDERGEPVNEKYAECRAAARLHRYRTGKLPPGEPDIEPRECRLH
ncbi:hypothetical protein ACF07T_16745 [Streptomyces sp. NPDC015184]|uniref:DUF7677 family protein n=1 Tax=Streptomyces sp. NPDC015184 TaxID=3364946 RepID=UPI0037024289